MAKTAVGVAGRLRRQWLRWLTEHGEAYEYDATVGPTVEHVLHFQTHGFKTRQNYSSLQLDGLGDSWGELAVPYLLAKFVFTVLKYPGWVGLHRYRRKLQRGPCERVQYHLGKYLLVLEILRTCTRYSWFVSHVLPEVRDASPAMRPR